jgi:uncharacterized LabA/DUF88 family protein
MTFEHSPVVAIYWDFENLHAALYDEKAGDGKYRKADHRGRQEPLINVRAIVKFAATLGTIRINQAYANWQGFSCYREDLLANVVDLVQLFSPSGRAKNGADIRLAIDVTRDLQMYREVSHVVIVGGDSDYISLAQHCRRVGRTVIGIATKRSVNKYLVKAFDQFKYYKELLGDTVPVLPSRDRQEAICAVSVISPAAS